LFASYHVPSETGSLEPGERQFIWVWYEKVAEDSDDFRAIFTDVMGTTHQTTIPRGAMQPGIWAALQARGTALSAPFAELLAATTDPFVSAIRECAALRAVFHEGKLVLVGDAFALLRPHVAASTNQAAKQALGLAELFSGRGDLAGWERESVGDAARTGALSVAFAEYCFTGKVPGSLSGAIKADEESK
jgi:2-polyprenyl-6-methoxyphenol hydroxylase-like FAD-dependent oxidoreductase